MIDGSVVAKAADAPLSTPVVGMTTRVIRGGLWTLSGQCVTLLASLVTIPFVIRLLGSEAYGVLALINVLIGYLGFADFGMGTASTRFGAQSYARQDEKDEIAVVWTALLISFGLAASSALALALFAEPLVVNVLRLPEQLQGVAVVALRVAVIGFVARSVSGVLNTPQIVRLRMDLNTLITTGAGIAQICLIPLVLFWGGGLVAAVAVTAGVAVVTALSHLVVSGRLLPRLFKPRISPSLIKPLMSFGSGLVFSTLASVVLVHAEKLLLTRLASITALAHYSVAYAAAGLLALAPAAMGQSLMPAFSRLQAEPDGGSLERLYTRVLRANLLLVTPVALLLCAAAEPLFTFWAGPEYGRESALPFYILVGGLMLNILAYVPYALLISLGKSGLVARIHVAELLPYVVCAAALIYLFGAVGAALAWSLRVAADAIIFFLAVRRISGFSFAPIRANKGIYVVAVAALLAPVPLIVKGMASQSLLLCVTLVSLVFYTGVVWMRVVTDEERAWASSIMARRMGWLMRKGL